MTVRFLPATPWQGRSDPEDGVGALRLHHLEQPNAPRGLIGFACDAGVARNKGRIGAKHAPDVIRKAMANLAARRGGPSFTDLGTIAVEGDDLEVGQDSLSKALAPPLSNLERVIVLGGGHDTAFASFSGLRRVWPDARIGIINLDAHLDIRALATVGPSSGTPFFQIRALDPDAFDYVCLGIAEEANTGALQDRARDWGVVSFTDREVESDITGACNAIKACFERNEIVYLTIDMDVLPHFTAPGVSAPAVRGVSYSKVEALVECALECARLGLAKLPLADIVEVCPPYDQDGITARTAAYLARILLCG